MNIESIIVEEMEKYGKDDPQEHGGQTYYSLSDIKYKSVAQDITKRIKERVESLDWMEITGKVDKVPLRLYSGDDILALFKEEGGNDERI